MPKSERRPIIGLANDKKIGVPKVKAFLSLILNDLANFFNIGKNMNAYQIEQTIQIIWEEYYDFAFADFRRCFNKAKKGFYGKIYDRLDGNIILEWLREYSQERESAFENYNQNRHASSPTRERVGYYKTDPLTFAQAANKALVGARLACPARSAYPATQEYTPYEEIPACPDSRKK